MSKRANNEGSIYRRKDGRWVAAITLSDGRRKSFYGATQREVLEKRNIFLIESAGDSPTPTLTVGEWLTEWIEEYKRPYVRHNTYKRLATIVYFRLIPALGSYSLTTFSDKTIRHYLNQLTTSGELKSRSVHYLWEVLKAALDVAVERQIIERNPVRLVPPPKKTYREGIALSPQQISQFLRAIKGEQYENLYAFAVMTGMRSGELIGLTWEHVDLDAGIVRIRQQAQRTPNGMQFVPLKTERSKRDIHLSPTAVDLLRMHRMAQDERNPLSLVFPTSTGTILSGDSLTHRFKRVVTSV